MSRRMKLAALAAVALLPLLPAAPALAQNAIWNPACNGGLGGVIGLTYSGSLCQLPGSGGGQTVTWPLSFSTSVNPIVFFVQVDPATGKVVDLSTPVPTQGSETQGSAVTGNMSRMGCRGWASTTPPPGAGDGGAQDPACTNEGKLIIKPFSPKDLDQRGTGNSASGTAPTAFTGWSAPAANTYAYITQIQCHREDAGTTPYHVTLNDTVSTVVGLPPNGGNTISYGATPLRVSASATAPTFTSSNTGLNVYCDAQGYNGP